MKFVRRFVVTCSTLVALGGVTPGFSQQIPTQDLIIGFIDGSSINTLTWIAEDWGLFKKHHLNPKWIAASGPQISAGLVSQSFSVGVSTPSLLSSANSSGECQRIAATSQDRAIDILVSSNVATPNLSAGFPSSIRDLKGKRIGVVSRGGAMEVILNSLLKSAGLDPEKDVQIIAVGAVSTSIAAMENGAIDALMGLPPMKEKLAPGSFKVLFDGRTALDGPVAGLIFGNFAVSCDYQKKNPQLILNYCKAMWDAYDTAMNPANDKRNMKLIGEKTGLRPEQRKQFWSEIKSTISKPALDKKQWEQQSKWLPEGTTLPSYDNAIVPECVQSDPRKVSKKDSS